MKLETLLAGLNSPHPSARLTTARVLGVVQETRALDAIRTRYQAEADPDVRSALAWAGKRLFDAEKAGDSTVDGICRHFGIDREIANMDDPAEAELLRKMQYDFDNEMLRMRESGGKGAAAMRLASTLASGATMDILQPGAAAASSNLGPVRESLSSERTPPILPTNTDIRVWAKRLRDDPNPANRRNAANELRALNNPAALPHLAEVALIDPDPTVCEAAQQAARLLYLSLVYYQMDRDGLIEDMVTTRARAAGKLGGTGGAGAKPAASPTSPTQEDVSAILNRAQASRSRRRKR